MELKPVELVNTAESQPTTIDDVLRLIDDGIASLKEQASRKAWAIALYESNFSYTGLAMRKACGGIETLECLKAIITGQPVQHWDPEDSGLPDR